MRVSNRVARDSQDQIGCLKNSACKSVTGLVRGSIGGSRLCTELATDSQLGSRWDSKLEDRFEVWLVRGLTVRSMVGSIGGNDMRWDSWDALASKKWVR